MTTQPSTIPQEVTERLLALISRHAVVLHNDDVNEMSYVVRSLLKSVPELSSERAQEIMQDAHSHGRAVVVVCPFEQAELYRDRLESFGLTATLETT